MRNTYFILKLVICFTMVCPLYGQSSDPAGGLQKKALLKETVDKLLQKGLPTTQAPIQESKVFVFLLSHTNTGIFLTKPFQVTKYSDGTWPFANELIKKYARKTELPVERTHLVGFFTKEDEATKEWNTLNTLIIAYGLRVKLVPFNPEESVINKQSDVKGSSLAQSTNSQNTQNGLKVVNLPDAFVAVKGKITLGILPIIDSSSNLSQQFSIYQFLHDNPIVVNEKDTLHATITDTRTFTHFAISGFAGDKNYKLKIWQKDKMLGEVTYAFPDKQVVSYKDRLVYVAEQIGKTIGQGKYKMAEKLNLKNIIDQSDIITSESKKSTFIISLFPDTSTYYVPSTGFIRNSELAYLNQRLSNKGFDIGNYTHIKGAQLVRAIYGQKDDRLFFLKNSTVPEQTKEQVKKLVQPSSRRLGAALSYIAIGLDSKSAGNLDLASSCFYSALLLSGNLAGSMYEKAWIKRILYRNMAEIYKKRSQPVLSEMLDLAANLNDSFLKSSFSKLAHVQYYRNLEKLAQSCATVEESVRMVQASKNSAIWLGLLTVATTAGAKGGIENLSGTDIALISGQVGNTLETADRSIEALKDIARDISFDQVEDTDGTLIELNKLYLGREIVSHVVLRQDHETVAKQISNYADNKPNLHYHLEEVYAEDDKLLRNQAINNLLAHLRMVETQGNLYESRGRQVPASKTEVF